LNNSQKWCKIYLNAYYIKEESVGFIRRQLGNEIAGQLPAGDKRRPKSKVSFSQQSQNKKIFK
jgi:hypothetical protein